MANELFLTALVNLGVGLLIGWSGIAGFLLPIFYVGYLGLPVNDALTLSFSSFAVSGAIGSAKYHRQGNLPMASALPLGLGSLVGAVPGVLLNSLIPAATVKCILYLVVLASGISILLRERAQAGQPAKNSAQLAQKNQKNLQSPLFLAALGATTAVICALSGAGGPVLVMPLLVLFGMDVRWAIGVALFDSIFIALPSIVGYGLRSNLLNLWPLLVAGCLAHAAGVYWGSHTSARIRQKPLKMAVSIASIVIALYMLGGLLLP